MRHALFALLLSASCTAENSDGGVGGLGWRSTHGDSYIIGLRHLSAQTEQARRDTAWLSPCQLWTMRRDARVYTDSPFDRIADAWAVHDFMIGPPYDAYSTPYEVDYDVAARDIIAARQAADDKADECVR